MSSEQKTEVTNIPIAGIGAGMASSERAVQVATISTIPKGKDAPLNHASQDANETPNALFPCLGAPDEEAADERVWVEQFAASPDFLDKLVAEAQEERRLGKTLPLETVFDE